MKKYKGYYIDGIQIKSEKEIDDFIKSQSIDRFVRLTKMFLKNPIMEISIACDEAAEYLNKQCSMSFSEIENIEIEAIKEVI